MKGFTLIEMLISLTITMLILALAIGYLINIDNKFKSIDADISNYQIKTFVLERIWLDIYNSKKILPDSNDGQIKMLINNKIIAYDYYNNKIRRLADGYTSYLTEDNNIEGMKFKYKNNLIEISIWLKGFVEKTLICKRR